MEANAVVDRIADMSDVAASAMISGRLLQYDGTQFIGVIGSGGGSDAYYLHTQLVPADTWTITHNLNKYVAVTVTDSSGRIVVGDVVHTSLDVVTIFFSAAFGGRASCN